MSLLELRQYVESAVPVWAYMLFIVTVLPALLWWSTRDTTSSPECTWEWDCFCRQCWPLGRSCQLDIMCECGCRLSEHYYHGIACGCVGCKKCEIEIFDAMGGHCSVGEMDVKAFTDAGGTMKGGF